MDADERCQMGGCTRAADRTMTFRNHEDIDVCGTHYRRNVAIKYGVLVAVSVVLAAIGLGVYWLVL